MEKDPFTYHPKNPRVITNVEISDNVSYLTGAMFLYSLKWYSSKRFRVDQNAIKFGLFAIGSLFSSYAISDTILNNPDMQAAQLNNDHESEHQGFDVLKE